MRFQANAGSGGDVRALVLCAGLLLAGPTATAGARPQANPFEVETFTAPPTEIDGLVFARLEELGITPAKPCSDAVFLRRAHFDVIGTLPTPQEARMKEAEMLQVAHEWTEQSKQGVAKPSVSAGYNYIVDHEDETLLLFHVPADEFKVTFPRYLESKDEDYELYYRDACRQYASTLHKPREAPDA